MPDSQVLNLLAIERERRRRALSQQRITPLADWLPATSPHLTWSWPYLKYLQTALSDLSVGRCSRLMLALPPRHGKSELATIHYPAWRLSHSPQLRIAIACYNQTLAEQFSRRVRAIVRRRSPLILDPERQAVDDWRTAAGGGLRAAGVGSGVTGSGFNLLVIDDPVKSREEANSPAYRERCWDWYSQDLYTRLEPGGAILVIQTRWHEDDLAGRILASEQAGEWTVISLPAEAEAGDPLGRRPGEPLCPERFDLEALRDIRATLTELPYAALYQQRPVPLAGALFQAGRVGTVTSIPAGAVYCRGWDIAATAAGGDWTVGVLVARHGMGKEQRFFIVDVVRGQWGTDQRDRAIRATADQDVSRYGTVLQWLPQDPGAAGKSQAVGFTRLLAGHRVTCAPVSGDKAVRADAFSAQWNAGDGQGQWNVALLVGAWNQPYLQELLSFPYGRHDDQVDASSSAFNVLAASVSTRGNARAAGAVSPLVLGVERGGMPVAERDRVWPG